MKISELITQLEELKEKHGDLPIYTYERNHGGPNGWILLDKCPIEYLLITSNDKLNGYPDTGFYL